jgi:ELWxxDGT repeat protein
VLKNIAPTSHDSNPSYKARVSQYLFFTADDLFHGTQLWRSDGTTAQMVQDHNTLGRDSLLRDITQINGAYYFAATDASRVWNLWKKDTDLKAVRQLSDYTWVVQLADKLYFVDGDRKNLMSLDPQTDAADTVKKFDIIDNYSLPVTLEEKLCLVAKQSGYNDIWCTDGTQTQKVTTFGNLSILTNIDYLSVMGDKLFFVASDGAAHGKEIFVTGLTGGPVILKDINPSGDSDPRYLTVMGDKLYFSANDGARGTELWSSDGTESGTRIVKDIRPNAASADPKDLFATDERLYFVADDGMHGRELWVSDGSPSGTHMVADAVTGAAGSKPNIIATYKNSLIYTALSGGESYLWLKPSANSVSLKVSKEKIFHAWKTGDMFEGALIESIATDGSKQLYLIGSDPDKSTLLWRE